MGNIFVPKADFGSICAVLSQKALYLAFLGVSVRVVDTVISRRIRNVVRKMTVAQLQG